MNRTQRWAVIAAAMLVLANTQCSKKKAPDQSGADDDAGAHVDEAEHGGIPKRVKLTDEVIAAAGIKTAPATKEVLAATLTLPGEISADPDTSARIASPVAGRLSTVKFKEGDAVKKGDLLATVRIPEIGKLRASYTAVGAKAAAARSNA
ncbi:MAG: biotin/lipoyl-binding protein, partial [Polyangiaceae bacterium]